MVDIAQFYDSFKDQYTESVHRCNPCYNEMIGTLFEYLPGRWVPEGILELGCGTGNLTLLLGERFPQARLIGVDISEGCLEVCRRRMGDREVELQRNDIRELQLDPESFDLVTSSLAIHHLTEPDRQALYASVYGWLRAGGLFVFCDRFKDENGYLAQANRRIWKESAFARGTTEEDWEQWSEHEAQHDRPGFLVQQVIALKDAGFATSDIVWRKHLWATVYSQKGAR
jgi:tRNA (cmo5U34)-methyltransferase